MVATLFCLNIGFLTGSSMALQFFVGRVEAMTSVFVVRHR